MIETNGEKDNTDPEASEDLEAAEDPEASEDEMPDIGGDTMVDISAEINVEELVAKIEAEDTNDGTHKREVRKRLEELREQKEKDLDSTFNFNLDDEL